MKFIALLVLSVLVAVEAKRPLVCYYESWATYRQNGMSYGIDKIPTDLCTHVIYTFAGLDSSTWKIKSLDSWIDIDKGGFKNTVALRQKNPDLVVTIAIGGWNEGGQKYSQMVADASRRKSFIDSVVNWMSTYDFDGIDLDWEYPGATDRGGAAADKQNFILLLKELRAALDGMGGRHRIITVAVGVAQNRIDAGYDIPAMTPLVDYIHLMTYDMHGSWDNFADHQSPLHRRSFDTGDFLKLNIEDVMNSWKSAGVPASKLIMGIPLYGRSYTLSNANNHDMKAATSGAGLAGPYTQQAGFLAYFELCGYVNSNGYSKQWEDSGKTPYMYQGNQWISYDDRQSVTAKTNFVVSNGFGGAMVWAVDNDDYTNACGGGVNPILTAIHQGLDSGSPTPAPTTPTPSTAPTSPTSPTPSPAPTSPTTTKKGNCDGSFYRILPDCTKFYQCVNDVTYNFTCPTGLIFNPANQVCDWPTNENSNGCS